MNKKANRLICLAVCLILMASIAATAYAASEDVNSLRIVFADDHGGPFANVTFQLYHVAEGPVHGHYTLTENFADSGVDLDFMSNEKWTETTASLCEYVEKNKLAMDEAGKTDARGLLLFTNLEGGLYLVIGESFVQDNRNYKPQAFCVTVPDMDEYGNPNENYIVVEPKFDLIQAYTTVTVQKVWVDAGHEKDRPESVTVALIADGVTYAEVELNKENHWSFRWDRLDGYLTWTVKELNVPTDYSATVARNGNVFTITNKYEAKDETPPPKTGDESPILMWVVLSIASVACAGALALSLRKQSQ